MVDQATARSSIGNLRHLVAIAPTVEQQARTGALERDITELAEEIGAAAAVDGDLGHVTEVNLGFIQAIVDRLRRESGPMLHAPKPLLLGGGEQFAVAHDARRGVRMIGIDAEY